MRYQKIALNIVTLEGKSGINSVCKIVVCLLLSLTLPVLVVAESREVAIAQVQTKKERKQEALRLNQLGLEQLNKNQFREALETFQKVLVIVREIGERRDEGTTLNNIGLAYDNLGQYPKALEFYQQSLTIYKQIGDKAGEGTTLNNVGGVYDNLGQYPKALEFYQPALMIRKKMDDKVGEGQILNNIGLVYRHWRQNSKALEFYQQALTIYKQINNKVEEGNTLNNIGLVYDNWGQYPKALEFYQQALIIYKQINNKAKEGVILNNIGSNYSNLGQYPKALEFYQQALMINKQINDKAGEGKTLSNIGGVYDGLGQYPKALEFYQQALIIYKQIGDKAGEGETINSFGLVYHRLGKYAKALDSYQQALAISKQIGDKAEEEFILNNIGGTHHILGQHSKALEFYQQALAIHKQIGGNKGGEGVILNNIAKVYDDLGQYPKALESYKQALVIRKQIGHKAGEGNTLNNIGLVYDKLGQYPKALESHQQALAIRKQIGDKAGEGVTLNNIGLTYSNLGQYAKALEYFQQALVVRKQVGDKAGEGITLNNTGYVLMQTGKLKEATETLHTAIEVQELLRLRLKDTDKVSIIDTQRNSYRFLQKVYIAQNQYEEALEISERGRGRAFVELLAEKQKTQVQPKPTINQLKQIAKDQNATLVEYSIINEEFKIEEKKQWLESQLYIWVIKPTGEVAFKSVDFKKQNIAIASLIPRFRKSLNIGSRSTGEPIFNPGDRVRFKDDGADAQLWEVISFDAQKQEIAVKYPTFAPGSTPTIRPISEVDDSKQAPLQELHKLLIEPIAQFLPTKETDKIIFIPQEELFSVPFPALQDAKGKFLIEKHTILTAPSIQVLDLTRKQRQKLPSNVNVKEALVVGNPNPMPQPFTPLKYATREAQAIAKLYNTQPIIGSAATESAIVAKMPNARIIHLATHGDFNNSKGLESKIVLAPDAKNDGFLTAGEIFDLFGQPESKSSLHAELVVLSACDTGRGQISGDGVIGLSRSLISAGVPSVVVSLWSVDDAATEFLMTEFYKQLKNNSDKATALRIAMLATMKQDSNPRLWAAFTLIGEAD